MLPIEKLKKLVQEKVELFLRNKGNPIEGSSQKNEANQVLEILKQQYSSVQELRNELIKKCQEINKKIRHLIFKSLLAEYIMAVINLPDDVLAILDGSQKDLKSYMEQVLRLQSQPIAIELHNKQSELNNLNSQVNLLASNVAMLESTNSLLQSENIQLKKQVVVLQTENVKLSADNEALQSKVMLLEQKVDDYVVRFQKFKQLYIDMETEMQQLQIELAETKSKISCEKEDELLQIEQSSSIKYQYV